MIGDIFYNLFIMPLELIFEVIFWFLREHPPLAIVAISVVMNFLALPLYRRADAIQEEERDKVASMAYRVGRIKKTFKGDERYMMLTTYYRQQNYKQIYSLRSTFPLLLQVPFFIAAYHYLSNLSLLNGVSFLFLKDLGAPDQLISLGSFNINVMPILMTAINVVSAFIYLKGFPIKDKIQTYGIAAIFLILLYNSPSGLVFYWTLNQVFSVLKNVFMKLVKSRKVLNIFFSCLGVAAFVVLVAAGILSSPKKIAVGVVLMLICQVPSAITFIQKARSGKTVEIKKAKVKPFILGALFISILLGIVIPMSVISSSPTEFMTAAVTPATIVINNFCICAGFFIIWLGIYFYMSNNVMRTIFTYAVWIASGVFMMDFMLFSKSLGVMSTYLVFNNMPSYSRSEKLINLLAVVALAAAMILVMKYLKKVVNYVYLILILGSVVLAGINIFSSVQQINEASAKTAAVSTTNETAQDSSAENSSDDTADDAASEETKSDSGVSVSSTNKIIPLSKEGKNVIVIMMDRAIGGYLPYIFNEKPQLKEQFAGFTYYPNMVSFGSHTNYGTPALFGGYEYTPYAINLRADESLGEKHDEALLVMPTMFSNEGYEVTVFDAPYAGYTSYEPDFSIYDGLENIHTYRTYGAYATDMMAQFSPAIRKTQKRNFFFYSLMRAVPTLFQNTVYNNGNYYSTSSGDTFACSDEFINAYSVLYSLPEITDIQDGDTNTVLIMENDTTHANTILQTPEYEPSLEITSDMYADQERFTLDDGQSMIMETEYQISHYDVNVAAYLKLGEWFDYLRENDVFDNTRIIIVSDHGNGIGNFENLLVADDWDAEWVYSLLLYKDFGDTEFTVNEDLMMTADVPYMAMEGVIDDMTNPYTGNEITDDVDKEEQLITSSHNWSIFENTGNTFDVSDGSWWKVHGDMREAENWERVTTE